MSGVREIPCPGCGEILGVPEELDGGPIRCGVCERVIQTGERSADNRPRRSEEREDDDAPRRRPRADDDFDRPRKKKSGCGPWVWILGIIGVLALVCCGGGGVLLNMFVISPKWEKFTPPDARWSAEFPGKPTMETKPIENVPGAGNGTYYTGQRLFGQEAYLVGYADLKAENMQFVSAEQVMNESLNGILKGPMSAREVSRRNLKMTGVDAKELVIDVTVANAGSGRMVVRVLVADDRFYTLIAVKMGSGGKNPEYAEKFFNSFSVTAKPPAKPAGAH